MSTHTNTIAAYNSDLSSSSVSFVSFFQRTAHEIGTIKKRANWRTLQRTTHCDKRCTFCKCINDNPISKSNATNTNFGMIGNDKHDCDTAGVIYLIQCRKCTVQYVGLTKNKLKQRLSGHKNSINNKGQTLIAQHFQSNDHSFEDLTIKILEVVGTDKKDLHDAEHFWIRALNTAYPLGLNENVRGCHGLVKAKTYDGNSGTPFLQIRGARSGKPRKRGSKILSTKSPSKVLDHIIEKHDSQEMHKTLFELRKYPKSTLCIIRKMLCTMVLDNTTRIIAAFTSGLIALIPRPKHHEPEITIVANYVNHGLGTVMKNNIFNNHELRRVAIYQVTVKFV